MSDRVEVWVARQDGPNGARRRQRFVLPAPAGATVADLLDAINADPRDAEGSPVEPIAWESGCAFPVCGSCAMTINGRAALACGTRLGDALRPRWPGKRRRIELGPLEGFRVLRDLWVDRSELGHQRARLAAWIDPDSDVDPAPERARFARCTECGACLAACPEWGPGRAFVGPAALGASHHARLAQPSARAARAARLMQPGGIDDCGRAENCIAVCPEAIDLDEAMAAAAREVTGAWLARLRR